MSQEHDLRQWRTEPFPEHLPDDDDAYNEVALQGAGNPHYETILSEVTGAEVRAVYEGKVNMYGDADDSMALSGGTVDGKMYANDTAHRGIEEANRLVQVMSAGEFQLLIVDVLRLSGRQRDGFKRTAEQMMRNDQVVSPEPADLLRYGAKATRIFSRVRPQANEAYQHLFARLKTDAVLMRSIASTVEVPANDASYQDALDNALRDYITTAANMGIGEPAEAGLDLTATHIVHGGGATIDFFIGDAHGKPISIVPFDYPDARLAAYRFTENDENFDVLIQAIGANPALRAHFQRLGYNDPTDFTRADWQYFKEANRVQVKLIMAMNGTTYKDERWHFEFGEDSTSLDGSLLTPGSTGNSGGTGYTSIRHGAAGTAPWHTEASENYLRRKGLLQE